MDADFIKEAAAQHIRYTKFTHTLQLLRWYGKVRNKGEYNKDAFFVIIKIVETMKMIRDDQDDYALEKFP